MSDERLKEVAEEYLSSLTDLTINSKPLITMLTMLAEDNIEYAAAIVDTIEKQITSVANDLKLPILYLIDSIVKNVARDYRVLFTKKIVNLFCDVFSKVNERVREKMFTLRQTWNDVFPMTKLYILDVKVHHIDPGWPITAAPPVAQKPAIHVNPRFFNNRTPETLTAELQQKQIELLELQKKKKELEKAVSKKTESVKNQNRVPVVGEVPVPISSLPPIPKIRPTDPRLARQQQNTNKQKKSPVAAQTLAPPSTENNHSPSKKSSESRRTKSSNDSTSSRKEHRSSKNSSSHKNGTSPSSKGGSRGKRRERSPSSRPLKRSREKSPDAIAVAAAAAAVEAAPVAPTKKGDDKPWVNKQRERKAHNNKPPVVSSPRDNEGQHTSDVDLRMQLPPPKGKRKNTTILRLLYNSADATILFVFLLLAYDKISRRHLQFGA